MAKVDRSDEAKVTPIYLGTGTKDEYGPVLDHIKKNVGLKKWVIHCLNDYKQRFM